MLKTEVISDAIPIIFPDIDWSAWDCERFWDQFWDQFWLLCTAFPRIPLLQILCWEEEKLRSTYSNRDNSLWVDQSKVLLFWLRFLFNDPKGWPQSVTATGSPISWRQGSNRSRRLIGRKCIKEEFPSDMGFWVREGLSLEVVFVEKMGTSDKDEVVERRFSGRKMPDKETFWDKESVSDSTSLSFWESQSGSRLNRQCQ